MFQPEREILSKLKTGPVKTNSSYISYSLNTKKIPKKPKKTKQNKKNLQKPTKPQQETTQERNPQNNNTSNSKEACWSVWHLKNVRGATYTGSSNDASVYPCALSPDTGLITEVRKLIQNRKRKSSVLQQHTGPTGKTSSLACKENVFLFQSSHRI